MTNVLTIFFYFIFVTEQQDNKTPKKKFLTQNYFSMPYLLMKIKLEAINFHEKTENFLFFSLMVFNQFFFLHSVSLYTHLITISSSLSIYFSSFISSIVYGVSIYILSFFNSQYFKKKKKKKIFFLHWFFLIAFLLDLFFKRKKKYNEQKEIFLWLNICYIYHIIQYLITSISHRCSFPPL